MYESEGYRLMGAAFEVHNRIGYGLSEEVYQQCLEIELELQEIPYQAKQELNLWYRGRKIEKRYVPDLVVFGAVVVELKAVTELVPEHEAQLFNYLRIARRPVGYLINFGQKDAVQWKRFIVSDLHPCPASDKPSEH